MKSRSAGFERLVIAILLLGGAYHLLVEHILPATALALARQLVGPDVTIERVRWELPRRVLLSDVRVPSANGSTCMRAPRIALELKQVNWRDRTIRFQSARLDAPSMVIRRRVDGTIERPAPPRPATAELASSSMAGLAGWTAHIEAIQVADADVVWVDERAAPEFRESFQRVSASGGPLAIPWQPQRVTLALQAELEGATGPSPSLYCSGWVSPRERRINISCELQPIRLGTFDAYYPQWMRGRVTRATIRATAHLLAEDNDLDGRVQLRVESFSDADMAFFRRDIRRLTIESGRALAGELQLSGPVDQPSAWRLQLWPGNEPVQRVVAILRERGLQSVRVNFGGRTEYLGIGQSSEATISTMETASRTIQDTLQLLAPEERADAVEAAEAAPSIPSDLSTGAASNPSAVPVESSTGSGLR